MMAIHLLLNGEEDERILLEYITKPPVFVTGIELTSEGEPESRLSVQDVLDLGYAEALTFAILHPELGAVTSVKGATRQLSWKTEVVSHRDYVQSAGDNDYIDIYLSPVIMYQRPFTGDDMMHEGLLIASGAEAYPEVGRWYRRIYGWCRRRATNVFSLNGAMFPERFVSFGISTRWAFPNAMNDLRAGREFCSREMKGGEMKERTLKYMSDWMNREA